MNKIILKGSALSATIALATVTGGGVKPAHADWVLTGSSGLNLQAESVTAKVTKGKTVGSDNPTPKTDEGDAYATFAWRPDRSIKIPKRAVTSTTTSLCTGQQMF